MTGLSWEQGLLIILGAVLLAVIVTIVFVFGLTALIEANPDGL